MRRKKTDVRAVVTALALLAAACLPAAAQESVAQLSLAQCLDAALSQGTDSLVLQKNLAISRAQYDLAVSQSAYSLSATPSTSLGFTTTPYMAASPLAAALGAFTHSTPGPSGSFGLSVSQVLWNGYPGGTAKASLEKSLLAFRGRQIAGDTGRQAITTAVTQAYFLALGAQRTLAVRQQVVEQQNALLAQMRAIRLLQQATDVDLRSAEINAQSAEIEVQSARGDLRIARIRLAQLVGWPRERELVVIEAEDPVVPASGVDEAIAEALKRRTDIQQIELNRQASAIDRALISGQTMPTVSLTGGANMVVDWNLLTNAGQGILGVKVGLPILDAGAAAHQLEANRLQNEVYSAQESQLRASIATDVEEAFNLVQVQLQRLQIAKLNSEKLDLQFTLKKTSAQYGTATNQDLLDASVNAGNAQSAVVLAQRNTQLAVLQLRAAMGL